MNSELPIRPNPPTDLCKHGDEAVCQICEPMPARVWNTLNYEAKRRNWTRRGCMPLRKRPKRLHKKLAKRGFSASTRSVLWASPKPGYGTKGTKYDIFYNEDEP